MKPKKHLGQHFLNDELSITKMIAALHPCRYLLEIGAGKGALTKHLVKQNRVGFQAVELDKEAVAYLQNHFSWQAPHQKLVHANILKLNWTNLFPSSFSIIGSLPYYISSCIFFKVFENIEQVEQMVCLVQDEVALRITSPHGSKKYGILSVLLQAFYDVRYVFQMPPEVFFPAPKVNSAVLHLKRNQRQMIPQERQKLKAFVKLAFSNRRKQMKNNLKKIAYARESIQEEILIQRAEALSVSTFLNIYSIL